MEVSYDSSNDSLVTTQKSGNYFQALLGLIQSMTADAQSQAAQQEKARDSGAMDALDDAYDNSGSSFGSLSDFGSIGQIANWDSDAYNDDIEDNILGWFSNTTKNNIDNVLVNREDLHIVDFYSQNLEEILEVIGDGTTD